MSPEEYAEQAVLGAILRDPRTIRDVHDLVALRPDDFSAAQHQALYRAMIEARANNNLQTIDDVQAFRAALVPHAIQTGRGTTWLRSLGSSTPHPDHALRYALIVMEGHNRRAIIAGAQRITAELAAATPQRLDRTQQQISEMRTVLVTLTTRWQQQGLMESPDADTTPVTAPAPADPAQPAATTNDPDQVRSRLRDRLPEWMRPEQRRTRRREEHLIASLVRDPSQLADVLWLRPDDFTTPQAAALFDAISILDARAEPVDAISVLAEAHRHHPIDASAADRFMAACSSEGRRGGTTAITLAREVIEQAITSAVNTHVDDLVNQVTRGTAGTAVNAAVQTLTKIEATVSRYEQSRQLTTGDTHAYVPPDPALNPPPAQQQAVNASAPS